MGGVEWYLELSGTTRRRIRIAIPLGGDLRKSVGAFAASYAPSRGCQTLSHAPRGHRECQRYTQGFQARIISIISWNFMWVPALRGPDTQRAFGALGENVAPQRGATTASTAVRETLMEPMKHLSSTQTNPIPSRRAQFARNIVTPYLKMVLM